MNFQNLFYIFLLSLTFSLLMVPMLRRWAIEKNEVDVPDQRKVHVAPVPRLGGVAIFIACLFSLLVLNEINQQVRGILAGGLVLFITGLVDDLHGLSPKKKFLGQVAACLVTMTVGGLYIGRLGDLFGLGDIVLPLWLAYPFTIVAVVGVINALNLLDGLDGLAGGFSIIALGVFLLLGCHHHCIPTTVLCVALSGGLLGFLRYNSHPAVIFMGDSGSLTIGFLLGFLAVLLTQNAGSDVQPVVPLIVLGLPILDTLRVMGMRICKRSSPFAADRTHVHHKLLELGLSHRWCVRTLYGVGLFWAIVALVFRQAPEHRLFFAYVGSMVCFYLALRLLMRNKENLALFNRKSARGELSPSNGSEVMARVNAVFDEVEAVGEEALSSSIEPCQAA